MELTGLYLYAYLVGSVPTAYIIGQLVKGIDIRQYGSGNVGGTNVFYSVGRGWIVPLGLFEVFGKGASPILIGTYVLDLDRASLELTLVPLCAIVGHNWTPLLKFTGGRGISVISGALLFIAPLELALFIAVILSGWFLFRSSSTWVYISLLLLPIWSILSAEPLAVTWLCVGIIGLVSAKRLVSNWDPLPADLPWQRAMFNRLIKDRDTDRREDWVHRTPINNKPGTG